MTYPPCAHEKVVLDSEENDNRIRGLEACPTCKIEYATCLAKRLDDQGREAWGPVGVKTYFGVKKVGR